MSADVRFAALAAEVGHDFSGDIKIGGNYTPVVRDGRQLWVSGQIPRVGDEVLFVGALGEAWGVAEGQQAFRFALRDRRKQIRRRVCEQNGQGLHWERPLLAMSHELPITLHHDRSGPPESS